MFQKVKDKSKLQQIVSTLQVFLQTTLQSLTSCLGSLHPLILLPPKQNKKKNKIELVAQVLRQMEHFSPGLQPSPAKYSVDVFRWFWVAKGASLRTTWRLAELAALHHFLFCTQIGIGGFGSSSSHLFLSVLLWYQMLICCFSIKIWLHLCSYQGAARSSRSVWTCPVQRKHRFYGKMQS